jgi:hypothetical protein
MQTFLDLLTDLHRSIHLVAQDLATDQPALAEALKRRAAWIPLPEEVIANPPPSLMRDLPSPAAACQRMPSLLYEALDEGVLNADQFDSLMVGQSRAARALRERAS